MRKATIFLVILSLFLVGCSSGEVPDEEIAVIEVDEPEIETTDDENVEEEIFQEEIEEAEEEVEEEATETLSQQNAIGSADIYFDDVKYPLNINGAGEPEESLSSCIYFEEGTHKMTVSAITESFTFDYIRFSQGGENPIIPSEIKPKDDEDLVVGGGIYKTATREAFHTDLRQNPKANSPR